MSAGTLYVVATPIGNLEDMTFRAVRVLKEVDAIACEDTRHSRILLDRYEIRTPTLSYHRWNEARREWELLDRLRAGENLALISDAGAPMLSDPGARLVARAAAEGLRVVPVPGASAPITALMAGGGIASFGSDSGLEPADETPAICFLGFLPSRAGKRRRRLAEWARWPGILVMFESPRRVLAALADLEDLLGGARSLQVGREMTKLHEEFVRGTIAGVRERMTREAAGAAGPRGEFTVVVGPPPGPAAHRGDHGGGVAGDHAAGTPERGGGAIAAALSPDMTRDDLKRLARATGVGRSELYRRLQQLRGKIKS